jgi:hypothetical protein
MNPHFPHSQAEHPHYGDHGFFIALEQFDPTHQIPVSFYKLFEQRPDLYKPHYKTLQEAKNVLALLLENMNNPPAVKIYSRSGQPYIPTNGLDGQTNMFDSHPSYSHGGYFIFGSTEDFNKQQHIPISSFHLFEKAELLDKYKPLFEDEAEAKEVYQQLMLALSKKGHSEKVTIESCHPTK